MFSLVVLDVSACFADPSLWHTRNDNCSDLRDAKHQSPINHQSFHIAKTKQYNVHYQYNTDCNVYICNMKAVWSLQDRSKSLLCWFWWNVRRCQHGVLVWDDVGFPSDTNDRRRWIESWTPQHSVRDCACLNSANYSSSTPATVDCISLLY